jgi:protein O-GlcNAc transferase
LTLSPAAHGPEVRQGSDTSMERIRKAQGVYNDVLTRVVDEDGRLLVSFPSDQLSHLQRALNSKASLSAAIGESGLTDLIRSVEIAVQPPGYSHAHEIERGYSFRDVVLAAYVAGSIAHYGSLQQVPHRVLQTLVNGSTSETILDKQNNLLRAVHVSAAMLMDALLVPEDGAIIPLLLTPAQAMRICMFLFSDSLGTLPSICHTTPEGRLECLSESTRQATHKSTCASLLYIAKAVQDATLGKPIVIPGFPPHFKASESLVLLIYYLALSLSPTAGIYNNIGLTMASAVPAISVHSSGHGYVPEEHELARQFFERGLQLDKSHPHLLTNLGSLLKDQGQTAEAIR